MLTLQLHKISVGLGLVDKFRYIFRQHQICKQFYFHAEFLQRINELINVDQKHEWTDATTLHNISVGLYRTDQAVS